MLAPLPQRSSGNAALDALIATAQKDDIVEVPAEAPAVQEPALPAVVDVQDIPLVQVVLSNPWFNSNIQMMLKYTFLHFI